MGVHPKVMSLLHCNVLDWLRVLPKFITLAHSSCMPGFTVNSNDQPAEPSSNLPALGPPTTGSTIRDTAHSEARNK